MQWGVLHKPRVPVDSGSFVKPSLRLRCIDAQGKNVFHAIHKVVGDVKTEFAVAAEISSEEMPVEPYDAIAKNPIELYGDPLAFVRRRNGKRSAVPSDTCSGKLSANRLEAVIVQHLLFRLNEFQLDSPIVRDIQSSPGAVAEPGIGRTACLCSFGKGSFFAITDISIDRCSISQMKFPAEVEEELFADRFDGSWILGEGTKNCHEESCRAKKS